MKISNSALAGLDDVVLTLSGNVRAKNRTFTVELDGIDIGKIRRDLGMTQKEFAVSFGFPLKTLQNWEQGIREPDGPARAYLQVIRRQPEMVLLTLRQTDDCHERVD